MPPLKAQRCHRRSSCLPKQPPSRPRTKVLNAPCALARANSPAQRFWIVSASRTLPASPSFPPRKHSACFRSKHDREHQNAWSRFETELAKRTAEIRERHKDELRLALSEKESLTRRVEDSLREIAQLREKNQLLEGEMSKVARIGKREEMDFAEEARTWAGVWISDKLPRNGDFILAYRAPNGDPTEPKILIDNKDKSAIAESDIEKLVRDAEERSIAVAALVTREESQLRQVDREARWRRTDGIWLLRTTRQWIVRDLDLLQPHLREDAS